ncbi:hypothetical protein C0R09_18925 [Brevibacillus laterosporus]|uniref:YopX family protein n=1 Tax=Brevibacillus laterosporus TaxID=1465 RepID=UPI000C7883EB|nr:YopX family protein [Brevibacillus laterosporus]AUM66427.1 hypothetical protein C0R09_18925 [Brevibacillus laterosporus]
MREIKFRMWDFENQEMINGDSLAFEEYAPISQLLSQKGIMQYTGLKDRNGKEIYEGDILKGKIYDYSPAKRFIGVLEYGYSGFLIKGVKQYKGMIDHPNAIYEVIGNIYENPELMEEVSR